MADLYQLTKNEVIKFFAKKSVFVLMAILLLLVFGYALYMNVLPETVSEATWRQQLSRENDELTRMLEANDLYLPDLTRNVMVKQLMANQYRLEQDLQPIKVRSISNFYLKLNEMFYIIVIMSIIGGIFFGFDGMSDRVVEVIDQIKVYPAFAYSLKMNLYNFLTLLSVMSLTMMVTLFFKSGIISTCTGILIYYLGAILALAFRNFDWMKYSLFANLSFSEYFKGVSIVEGITSSFSVMVVSVYTLIFIAISFLKFEESCI